jgi:hypothetical protein
VSVCVLQKEGNTVAENVTEICGLPIHPAAAVFPMMQGNEFDELKSSIRKSGVMHPVVVHQGKVIDGRNRLAAWQDVYRSRLCNMTASEMDERPPTVEWQPVDGDTVADYVMRANVHRRQLTPDQRAAAVVRLAALVEQEAVGRVERSQFKKGNKAASKTARSKKTGPKARDHKAEAEGTTNARLATQANVSPSRVKRAKRVKAQEESGELPAGTLQAVVDGAVEMRAIEKRSRPAKAEPSPQVTDERAAMRQLVVKEWDKMKKRFAVSDWPLVRSLIVDVVTSERKKLKG